QAGSTMTTKPSLIHFKFEDGERTKRFTLPRNDPYLLCSLRKKMEKILGRGVETLSWRDETSLILLLDSEDMIAAVDFAERSAHPPLILIKAEFKKEDVVRTQEEKDRESTSLLQDDPLYSTVSAIDEQRRLEAKSDRYERMAEEEKEAWKEFKEERDLFEKKRREERKKEEEEKQKRKMIEARMRRAEISRLEMEKRNVEKALKELTKQLEEATVEEKSSIESDQDGHISAVNEGSAISGGQWRELITEGDKDNNLWAAYEKWKAEKIIQKKEKERSKAREVKDKEEEEEELFPFVSDVDVMDIDGMETVVMRSTPVAVEVDKQKTRGEEEEWIPNTHQQEMIARLLEMFTDEDYGMIIEKCRYAINLEHAVQMMLSEAP
ncbi:hypothetical protein PMAYCL1PPCAC_28630, partial [Pristionchus mayeri]